MLPLALTITNSNDENWNQICPHRWFGCERPGGSPSQRSRYCHCYSWQTCGFPAQCPIIRSSIHWDPGSRRSRQVCCFQSAQLMQAKCNFHIILTVYKYNMFQTVFYSTCKCCWAPIPYTQANFFTYRPILHTGFQITMMMTMIIVKIRNGVMKRDT